MARPTLRPWGLPPVRKNLLRASLRPDVEYIGTRSTSDLSGAWSLDVSTLDIQDGDIGILAYTSDYWDGSNAFSVTPSVSTLWQSSDAHPRTRIFTREMDGTETTFSNSTFCNGVAQCIVFMLFRNALKPTGSEIAVSSQTSGMPDPPAITCTDGDMLACTGHHNGQLMTGSCTQTDFTVVANRTSSNNPYYSTASASYKPTLQSAGSYNPAGFVWSPPGSNWNDASTIRLRKK